MRLLASIKTAAYVAVLAAALLALPGLAAAESRPLYWGAWIGPQLTGEEPPWDMAAARRFERVVGRNLSILQFSAPFAKCEIDCSFYTFPTTEMEKIRRYGAIPLFSWNSGSIGNTQDFQLSDLRSGRYDSYIRAFARHAKAWGHPFFLRFDWEMNGDWFPWGATSEGSQGEGFKLAWRHVWRIFHRVGATNVTWVWCPYARDEPPAPFYPGSRYVDWTCLDGYNWGPESQQPTPWRTFGEIFTAAYHRLVTEVAPGKPMMIGEVATDDSGGDKAAWIREMFVDLRLGFPKVSALVWFDKYDLDVQWPIEISPIARAVFAQGLRRGNYKTNVFSRLRGTPIPAPGT
jgi:Glycosyl hydrolase family 26